MGLNHFNPLIVFGALDRHNFGDLLFAHVAKALLKEEKIFCAGLAQRDLRPYGGHRIHSLRQLADRLRGSVRILHAGGELLTCSAWEAAVMLLSASEAKQVLACCGGDAAAQKHWAREYLGTADHAPYALARAFFPHAASFAYNAVGGVDLATQNPGLREEVVRKLTQADYVAVRDRHTLAALHASGVAAHLLPDSAVMVAELFANKIEGHARRGEVKQVSTAFPNAYLAVQFSADFGQAAILDSMAAQLQGIAAGCACAIVLFRAGSAPWHDDLDVYRRLAARLPGVPLHIFQSINMWDICALLARCHAYCGSSLHGRIVALAFGRPRMNLRHPGQPPALLTKQEAFVQTWEDSRLPGVIDIEQMEEAVGTVLRADSSIFYDKAKDLTSLYRQGFDALRARFLSSD